MNILLSAFACEPNRGSEEGVGWNWAINLAKNHEVFVITREQEKSFIEKYLSEYAMEHIHFYYFEDQGLMHFIDKKIPYGFRIYYKWWQKKIVPIVQAITDCVDIDIIQQLTYNEYRTPGRLYTLGVPFVWGPIGGGHEYNAALRRAHYRFLDVILEVVRKWMNHRYLKDKDVVASIEQSAAILVADPATYNLLPKTRQYERLLETAYYADRNPIKSYVQKANYSTIYLMYAGVMPPRKGLKIIIEALGESDFRDFELVLIGDGKDRKRLEQDVKRYKIADQVKFLGKLSYDEVNSYYDWADLFLFPSLRDTSGNVILEAMSHGTPVIALNHNGAADIITEDTGELITIHNYNQVKQDFIHKIKKYYENREELERKGTNARMRIENIYSWSRVMQVMEDIYAGII